MGNQPSSPSSPPRDPVQEQVCGPDCQKQKDIANAFQAFQAASATKDSDPDTYAWAKFHYMSMKNGPDWAAQEKQRLVKTHIDPILNQYRTQYTALEGEYQTQRELVDVVEAVESKQSQMKASLEAQQKALEDSIEEKKSKIGVWNRMVELTSNPPTPSLLDPSATTNTMIAYFSNYPQSFVTILDVFLAVLIFFVVTILWRKIRVQTETIRRAGVFGVLGALSAPAPTSEVAATVAAGPGLVGRAAGVVKDYFPFFFVLLATIGIIVAIVYANPT
jgi:hypothetical protein